MNHIQQEEREEPFGSFVCLLAGMAIGVFGTITIGALVVQFI